MVSFTYLTTGPVEAEFTAGHTASWTSFDLHGACEVRIRRLGGPVETAVVRPLSAGIQPRIEDGEVVLRLDRPRKLCVECDGDLTDVLFLFANEPETEVPSVDDPNVVWFGPGVHEIGKFYELKPATTYYLAPGAFLKGSFAGGGDGTRIIGRGVLSGADYKWPGHLQEKNAERVDLVRLAGDKLALTGVTLVDSPYYVVVAGGRDNHFRDLKILAWHFNTDGISAGPGARIEDCFLRVADDAFKPFVSDTRISGCVLWVDRAAAFQLTWNAGHDSGGSEVRNCDVIHHMPFCTQQNEWTGAVFWSWHGGSAHIHDLLFEDIRIEGVSPCLFNLFLQRNPWSPQDGEWGRFSRLVFRNITCERPFRFASRLLGHDAGHPIADVAIENLTIAGCRIESPAAMHLETNPYVCNLRFDGMAVPSGRSEPSRQVTRNQQALHEIVFHHDGFGILADLARTAMTERDAADLLVKPLADAGVTILDWGILSTGAHNCRTRHNRLLDPTMERNILAENAALANRGKFLNREAIAQVIGSYAAQPLDLLDIVIKHGHVRGMKVYGNVRLNHANATVMLAGVPGRQFGQSGNRRVDFRDEAFHTYLVELFEDLLAKGADGLSLDFERKAPFFPDDTPQEERFEACRIFLRRVRALTDKPVVARVAYDSAKGAPQGQDPEGWLREGLLDAVIPATHNHEPEDLAWGFARFVKAAAESPRPCAVWPQIWPTPESWCNPVPPRFTPAQFVARSRNIFAAGGTGVYFFNYCCYWPRTGLEEPETEAMFRGIVTAAREGLR